MSIKSHKWSDSGLSVFSIVLGKELTIVIEDHYDDGTARASFERQDAIAIAKHFNVDNESLVEGVKELIKKGERLYFRGEPHIAINFSRLKKLITKEE